MLMNSNAGTAGDLGDQNRDDAQGHLVTQVTPAPKKGRGRKGHGVSDTLTTTALPAAQNPLQVTIDVIKELQTKRVFCTKQQIRVDNATLALIRRFCGFHVDLPEKERLAITKRAGKIKGAIEDGKPVSEEDAGIAQVVTPAVIAAARGREAFDSLRKEAERDMERLAKTLPAYSFVKGISGFGDLAFAIVVAEAGDLAMYGTISKVWKRLGLAVINGERQQKKSDKDLAAQHGYSPSRRAQIWSIFDPMMRHQLAWTDKETGEVKKAAGPYGEVYYRKKADYLSRVEVTAELPFSDKSKWTPKRADSAARRYVSKCVIADLVIAWRRAVGLPAKDRVAP